MPFTHAFMGSNPVRVTILMTYLVTKVARFYFFSNAFLLKYKTNHLFYSNESSTELSELDKLKKDLLAVTDARCKLRIYNIIKVSKRMRGNMEKFHYNPISLDEKSIKLFPNVETLHIYKARDMYLTGGRIERYVNWRKLSAHEYKQVKKELGKEIEYKRIVWTKNDTDKTIEKGKWWFC